MSETAQLGLPLLQPSQAQKHVTVNEALVRLDALTQLVLQSTGVVTPPVSALDGEAYAVPAGAVNAWENRAGDVAIWSNGGWVFATPQLGWRAFILDEGQPAMFDGSGWAKGALGVSPSGAVSGFHVAEFDHVIGAGGSSVTTETIPQYAVVFAVTGRIKTEITGTLADFDLGVAGAGDRYGNTLGLQQGSWLVGVSGTPVAYYDPTPLRLTANGGEFAGGEIRLVLHYYMPTIPQV